MATSSSFFYEEQFICSICLEVFHEPVSISCGHNFCKSCISNHWEGKQCRECPLCKKKFNKGYKLCVNRGFRDVVENFKKHQVFMSNLVKPAEVPCDCLHIKHKASNTCLSPLTSYCETHPEPHLRVPSLKQHKLSDPVKSLDNKICKKHNKIFELFCRNDQISICVKCTEHATHDMAPLEVVYEEKKAELESDKKKMEEMIQETQNKVQEVNAEVQMKRKIGDSLKTEDSEVFSTLVRSIQRRRAELLEKLDEKQRAVETLSERSIKKLKENVTELQTRSTKLEELSQTEDHLQLIQSVTPFSSTSPTAKGTSDISASSHSCMELVRRNLAELDSLTEEVKQIDKAVRVCWRKIQKDEPNQIQLLIETISTHFENIRFKIRQQPNILILIIYMFVLVCVFITSKR